MKKIKFLIASMLGAIALVFACVLGTRVNATTYNDYGTYTDTNGDLTEQHWSFPTSGYSTKSLSNNDILKGGIIVNGVGSSSNHLQAGYLSLKSGMILLIPVLDNSTGIVTVTATSGNTSRYLDLNNGGVGSSDHSSVVDGDTKTYMNTSGRSIRYHSNQITKNDNGSFLSFTAGGGECKVGSIVITSALEDLGDFTGLTVSNATTYHTGDTFSKTGLTVTATYENGTKTISSDDYDTSFSPALVNNAFASATEYTLTVSTTIDEEVKQATCKIDVTDIAKYDVTYYDADNKATTVEVNEGDSFDVKLTTTGEAKKFVGWSRTQDGEVVTDLSITKDETFYPIFSSLSALSISETAKTFDLSKMSGTTDIFNDEMTLYAYSNDSKITCDTKNEKISFGSNGVISGQECTNKYVAFKIPANSSAKLTLNLSYSTDTKTTYLMVACSNIEKIELNSKGSVSKEVTVKNRTSGDKFVKLYRANGANGASTITLNSISVLVSSKSAEIADTVTLSLGRQYNTSDATKADKMRFIGVINGIAASDYNKVSSVTISFAFNGSERTVNCYNLYKSVSQIDDSMTGGDNVLYVVYTLNSINKSGYSEKQLTNISITVNFSDNSSVTHLFSNITLPKFA